MKKIIIHIVLSVFMAGAFNELSYAQTGPDCPSGVCIGPGTSINDAAVHTITTNAYYSSMTIKNGGILTIRNGATLYIGAVGTPASTPVVDFQNGSVILIEAGGKLVVNGLLNNSNNSDNISVNGSIQVNGNVTLGNNSAIAGTGSVSSTGSTTGGGSLFGSTPSCNVGPCNSSVSCTSLSNSITASQTICSSATPSTLTGNGITGASYQWARSTTSSTVGFSDISGATSQNYSPGTHTQTTYYIRKATTNSGACLYTSNVATVTVSAVSATITTQPTDAVVCSGGSAVFTVTAAGPSLSYQWQSNFLGFGWNNMTEGGIGTGVTTNTMTIANPGSYTLYSFRVVVASVCGASSTSSTSNSVNITNGTGPTISTQPNTTNRIYCPGQTAATLSVNNQFLVSYQWYSNTTASNSGGTPVGTNSSSYTPSTTTPGTLYYYVVATNLGGCFTTSNVSGSYTTRPITSITPSTVPTLCDGAQFSLGGSPSGGTWSSSHSPRISIDPSTGVMTAGNSNQSAIITYTDPNTCTTTITVQPSMTNATTQTITGSNTLCANTTSNYTASPTTGGTWTSSNTSVASINSSTGVLTGVSAGSVGVNYSVVTGGCNSSTTKTVTINAIPTVSAGVPLSATCQGSTTALGGSFGGGATSAVWTDGGVGGAFANNGGTNLNTVSYTVPNAATGTITLTLTTAGGACGTASVTKTLTVSTKSSGTPTLTGAGPICTGSSATLGVSGGSLGTGALPVYYQNGYTEAWNNAPSAGNTYQTNTTVSSGILTATSTAGGDPQITMSGLGSFNPSLNRYITIRYRVTAGTAGAAQIFYFNAANPTPSASYMVAGNLVSDGNWNVLKLDMNTSPNWTLGGNITGWRYDWASAAGVTMEIDYISLGSVLASNTVSPTSATSYYVQYEGTCNVTQYSFGTVTVNARPTVNFSAVPAATFCSETDVTYATSLGQSNYVWSVPGTDPTDYTITNGGIGSTNNTVTLKWKTAGSKTVTVNYSNASGCAATTPASTTSTVNLSASVSAGAVMAATCQGVTTSALGGSFTGTATSAIWSDGGAGGSFANNGGTDPSITTYTVPSAATGTITLTLATSGGSCGTPSASKSFTVNTQSVAPTSLTGTGAICSGSSATLGVAGGSLGTGASAVYYQGGYAQEWNSAPLAANTFQTNTSASSGILTATSTGSDPQINMMGLGSYNPSTYRYITIRYRVTAGTAGNAQIFFLNTANPSPSGTHLATGSLVSDGSWNVLKLDMNAYPNWASGGNITGWRYDWANASGVTMEIDYIRLVSVLPSTTVSPTTATNYYVHYEGACNITQSSSGTVTVNARPSTAVLANGTGATSICNGSSANLKVTVTGGAGPYTVDYSGVAQNGYGNGNNIVVSPTTTTTYSLTSVTDANGCTAITPSGSPTVTVNYPPSISVQPVSASKCYGDNVTFEVTATGTGLSYQWKKGGSNIGSAVSSTYTINNITSSDIGSFTVAVSGTCSPVVTSNAAALSVGTTSTWNGGTNDWNTGSNWSCGIVPNNNLDVSIPSSLQYPQIPASTTVSVKNISLASGTSLTMLNSSVLNVYGNWNDAGTFNAGTGTVDFKGSSQTITKSGTSTKEGFYNLSKSSAGTLMVNSATDIDILPAGTLLVSAGTFDLNNRSVILKSWAPSNWNGHLYDSTARLGQVGGTLTNASNFAIERYIPTPNYGSLGKPLVKQRFVATSVSGMTAQQWADSVSIYGGPAGTGFKQRSSSIASVSTLQWYYEPNSSGGINAGYRSVVSRTDVLTIGKGYALSVGYDGAASTTLYSTPRQYVVLKMRGVPTVGNINVPVTKSGADPFGWNLVGNPYPGEIDWDLVWAQNSGVSSTMAILDPLGGVLSGQYFYYNTLTGKSIDPRYSIDTTVKRPNMSLIASSQSFFVFSNVLGTSNLLFTELHKPSNSSKVVSNFREERIANINIGVSNGTLNDNTILYLDPTANTYGPDEDLDVLKMSNTGLSVSSNTYGKDLAMNAVSPSASLSIPLTVSTTTKGTYKMVIDMSEFAGSTKALYLKDRYTGKTVDLTSTPTTIYPFDVTSEAISSGTRFTITSQTTGLLTDLAADEANGFQRMSLYPNPAVGGLVTASINGALDGLYKVEIEDLKGVTQLSRELSCVNGKISISGLNDALAAGAYVVRVTGEGHSFQQKLAIVK